MNFWTGIFFGVVGTLTGIIIAGFFLLTKKEERWEILPHKNENQKK